MDTDSESDTELESRPSTSVTHLGPYHFQRVNVNSTGDFSLRPLLHHSLKSLQASARSGCHLCTMISDVVSYEVEILKKDPKHEDSLRRAVGVVDLRRKPGPVFSSLTHAERLIISYYVDGEWSYSTDGEEGNLNPLLFTISLNLELHDGEFKQ